MASPSSSSGPTTHGHPTSSSTGTSKEQRRVDAEEKDAVPRFTRETGVITVSTNEIPGYRVVRVLGTVYGISVRARNWGADLLGVLRTVAGGEIRFFTSMLYRARNTAVERMIGDCVGRGGNAILAMRFDSATMGAMAQVCAYGTACIVEKLDDGLLEAKSSMLADF